MLRPTALLASDIEENLCSLPALSVSVTAFCIDEYRPFLNPCSMFSDSVTHSKLLGLLSVKSPLMWFTVMPFSGAPCHAAATALDTRCVCSMPSFQRDTRSSFFRLYLSRFGLMIRVSQTLFSYRAFDVIFPGAERTLPRSDASYSPSYPGIGFHCSIFSVPRLLLREA